MGTQSGTFSHIVLVALMLCDNKVYEIVFDTKKKKKNVKIWVHHT